jgi:hypothetical protein
MRQSLNARQQGLPPPCVLRGQVPPEQKVYQNPWESLDESSAAASHRRALTMSAQVSEPCAIVRPVSQAWQASHMWAAVAAKPGCMARR